MDRLSWMDYAARIQRDQPAIFLPVGALEQHGPHLPLGTDGLLAAAVAADTACLVGGLLAPTLSYGYKSQPKCGGGQHFSGTTSVDAATLIGSVRDAVREFARHGATRLVVVNGHYENQWFLIEGIDLGLRDLVSRHRSDVAGCAQPSERSARRSAQPIPSVLASDATPRCASMASADRQMIGDATLGYAFGSIEPSRLEGRTVFRFMHRRRLPANLTYLPDGPETSVPEDSNSSWIVGGCTTAVA